MKKIKFSILHLTEKQKKEIEEKSQNLGLSMNQMIIYGALNALKVSNIRKKESKSSSIQIRLPNEVHSQLQKKSQSLNLDMTDLIKLGLTNAFNLNELSQEIE